MARDNFLTPADIWKSLCYSSHKYHQSTVSSYLDVNPYNTFDLHRFESMLHQKSGSLHSLTFMHALKKLYISNTSANKSNIRRTFFYTYRKYCPKCLVEKNYYKLIWQLSSIRFCKLHNIKLLTQCWYCKNNIALLPLNGEVGVCPRCKIFLYNAPSIDHSPNELDLLSYNDWEYLFGSNEKSVRLTSNYEEHTIMLLKLLYLLKDTPTYKSESALVNLYKDLEKHSSLIHFHSIMNILKKTNTSLEYFINLDVPEDFIKSIV